MMLATLLLANRTRVPGHTLTDVERLWLMRAADLRSTHRFIQEEKSRYLAAVANESSVVRVRTHATISRITPLRHVG